jgi:hypothetical protein
MARKRAKTDSPRIGRPPILTEDREHELIRIILEAATNGKRLRKGEVLDEVERRYGKALTYGWINVFLSRHETQVVDATTVRNKTFVSESHVWSLMNMLS